MPSSSKVIDIGDVCLARYGKSNVEVVDFDKNAMLYRLYQYSTADDILTKALGEWKIPST